MGHHDCEEEDEPFPGTDLEDFPCRSSWSCLPSGDRPETSPLSCSICSWRTACSSCASFRDVASSWQLASCSDSSLMRASKGIVQSNYFPPIILLDFVIGIQDFLDDLIGHILCAQKSVRRSTCWTRLGKRWAACKLRAVRRPQA